MIEPAKAGSAWASRTAPSVVAALIATVVVVLTLVGTLDDLPSLLRGGAQALGTLAGVYLGARLQSRDVKIALEGAAEAALANLFALADSIKLLIATSDDFREHAASSSPSTLAAWSHSTETLLSGLDNQARMLLTQAEAAAAAWEPHSVKYPQTTRKPEEFTPDE